jgi:hypothetical protein
LKGYDPSGGGGGNKEKPLKYIGINMAGFDSGNATNIEQATYSCISDPQIDWISASGVNVVRCPIIPAYIFNEPPTGQTPYNPSLFSAIWTDGVGDTTNVCGQNNQVFNVGTYMSAIKYLVSKKINVIIDAHENVHYLCTFGDVPMTPVVFKNMWELIVSYILLNVEEHEYVWFELFNEPVQGPCAALTPDQWNNDYVIPTIQAIRSVESQYSSSPHYILTTTWGNYSGMQSWVQDGTLQGLMTTLVSNGYGDSDKSKVLVAGHQYCDTNYSGTMEKGCDPNTFNQSLYTQWVDGTTEILEPVKLKWFMSEGNVNCGYTGNCAMMNGGLYIDYLNYIVTTSACFGFSVWMSSLGDNYNGANMGGGPETSSTLFDAYKVIYPYFGDVYNFRIFFP